MEALRVSLHPADPSRPVHNHPRKQTASLAATQQPPSLRPRRHPSSVAASTNNSNKHNPSSSSSSPPAAEAAVCSEQAWRHHHSPACSAPTLQQQAPAEEEEACSAARQRLNRNRRAAASLAQPPQPQLNRHKEVAEGCSIPLPLSPPQRRAEACSTMRRMPRALCSAAAAETPTLGRRVCLDKSQRNPVVSLVVRLLPSQLRPHLAAYSAAASTNLQTSSDRILLWARP